MLRDERKKELKQKIFLKSIELFKEHGYDNVTVDKIVSTCGIAKGTFFTYFPKKEHVLLHLGNSQNELVKEVIQKHQEANLKKRLQLIFNHLFTVYLEHRDLLKLTLSETIRSALKEESTNIVKFKDALTDIIHESMQNGTFHSRFAPQHIASVLVGIYFNTLITWSIAESEEDLKDIFHTQFEIVWEGIVAQ
ncbi:TetR/AcrR family transcriptional regulator [Halalkalibacter urbisdiaboli]|uniref:TetR/AcrR family transcriptional regulator n=1 Tax=Halalkalibacter urbisdiaboli TaxID=1960589 RepID=UPI000B44332F|nr:TetR/AcrR family transcriptional regulator [Halalkalibacter urbisdiaboli]